MADLFGTYAKRIKLTIDHTNIDADVSHFPVTVFLTSIQGEEVFTEFDADADFDRIAFTTSDGETQLYADCELFGFYTSQYPPVQSDTYVKSTTKYSENFWAYYATDPTKLLTGTNVDNSWASAVGGDTNQRFHIDLGSAKVVKKIYYENYHTNGGNTNRGVKNFTFWGSNTGTGTFDDLDYANDDGWTQLTTSQNTFDEHIASDKADPKYITVTNSTAYRYYAFKFADNYGYTLMGVRHIELQIYEPKAIYHVSKTGWTVSSSADTEFYMYYDKIAGHNTTYVSKSGDTAAQSVYDSNFKAVYHMHDNTTSEIKDSTSNSNDGTKKAAKEPAEATGKVGQGQDFDGTDDYINCGSDTSLDNLLPITQAMWIYIPTSLPAPLSMPIAKGPADLYFGHVAIYDDGRVGIYIRFTTTHLEYVSQPGVVTANTWYHLAFVAYADKTAKIYVDGEEIGSYKTSQQGVGNLLDDSAGSLTFGRRLRSTSPYYFKGIIDEGHISDSARSAAWIAATYDSLWDTLLTYGDEETIGEQIEATGKASLSTETNVALSQGITEQAIAKATLETEIATSLSKGKTEQASGKSNLESEIDVILSQGEIVEAIGKANLESETNVSINQGKIENVTGKSNLETETNVQFSYGKILETTGKAELQSETNVTISQGKIEEATGISNLYSEIEALLIKTVLIDATGKANLSTEINITLDKGIIAEVSGKANLITETNVNLSKGLIEQTSGKASLSTEIDISLEFSRFIEATGKAILESEINVLLGHLKNVNGKAILDSEISVVLSNGKIVEVTGKARLFAEIGIAVYRIVNVNGKAYLVSEIELEGLTHKYRHTTAEIGIIRNPSEFSIRKLDGDFDIIN